MRRSTRLLPLALVASLALPLAGCSGKETSATEATDKLEVMSWWTSASEAPAFKVLTDAYAAANSGVQVTNASVTGGAGANARVELAKRLAAGNPPDVWQTFAGAATEAFASTKTIRDVSSVFATGGIKEAMQPTILDWVTVDGKQYAMPTGAHRQNVLFFNKSVLDSAGVAAPAAGYTTKAFIADLDKLKAKGATPLCLGGKDAFTTGELFENILLGTAGPKAWGQIQDDKFDWNGTAAKAAFAGLDKVLSYADTAADSQSWDQAAGKLAKGECGFLTMNDSGYGEIVKAGGSDTTVGEVAYPGTDGSYLAVVDVFVAGTTAPNAKNALAFLATLADPATSVKFSAIKGSVPVLKSADVASLPAYEQAASKALWSSEVLPSLVHGEAMSPRFTQGFYDGVAAYVRSRDAASFVKALSDAVNPGRPLGH